MENHYVLTSKDEKTKSIISSLGGTIQNFLVDGNNILFPYHTTPEGNIRGGCHMCAPCFGTSPRFPKKHGVLRDISMYSVQKYAPNSISMEFEQLPTEKYPWHLWYNTDVTVKDNEMTTTLRTYRLKDNNKEKAPINIGFHPYFANEGAKYVEVMEFPTGKTQWIFSKEARSAPLDGKGAIFIEMPRWRVLMYFNSFIEINGYRSRMVLWSDDPKKYTCIEPIMYDYNLFDTKEGCFLNVGDVIILSMTLRVEMKT